MTTATASSKKELLSSQQKAFIKQMMDPLKFRLFLLQKVPLGLIAGMRLKYFDGHRCEATMPYRWISTNPFKSTYFAALSMAAELSTGAIALLAVYKQKPTVAVIIVGMEAVFLKRATSVTTFTCEEGDKLFEAVEKAQATGEAVSQKVLTVGRAEDGTEVARFHFTWSFKRR